MGYHTMEEAIEGLTPEEIGAMRNMRIMMRRMMASKRFYAELNERNQITYMSIRLGNTQYGFNPDMPPNDDVMGGILGNIYLMAEQVLWMDPDFAKWIKDGKPT